MTDDDETSDTERNPDPQQHRKDPDEGRQPDPAPGDESDTSLKTGDDTDDDGQQGVNPANL